MMLLYRCSRIIIVSKLLKYMNKENKHCCLIPIVTFYNVLRHVIITLLLVIIICTWHYVNFFYNKAIIFIKRFINFIR